MVLASSKKIDPEIEQNQTCQLKDINRSTVVQLHEILRIDTKKTTTEDCSKRHKEEAGEGQGRAMFW